MRIWQMSMIGLLWALHQKFPFVGEHTRAVRRLYARFGRRQHLGRRECAPAY